MRFSRDGESSECRFRIALLLSLDRAAFAIMITTAEY